MLPLPRSALPHCLLRIAELIELEGAEEEDSPAAAPATASAAEAAVEVFCTLLLASPGWGEGELSGVLPPLRRRIRSSPAPRGGAAGGAAAARALCAALVACSGVAAELDRSELDADVAAVLDTLRAAPAEARAALCSEAVPVFCTLLHAPSRSPSATLPLCRARGWPPPGTASTRSADRRSSWLRRCELSSRRRRGQPCPVLAPLPPCSLLGNLSRNFPPRRPTRCASPPRCFVARAARTWPLSLQRCAGFSSCAGRCASRCAPQTRTSFSTCSPRWPRCSRRRWVRRWPSSCSSAARRLSRRKEVLGARAEDTEEDSCAQASSEGGRRSAYSLFGAHCANGAALPHLSLEQAAGAATSPVKSPTASEVRTEQAKD